MEAAKAESERDVGFGFKRSVGSPRGRSYETDDGVTFLWDPARGFKVLDKSGKPDMQIPIKELKESDEEFIVNLRKMAEQEGLLK